MKLDMFISDLRDIYQSEDKKVLEDLISFLVDLYEKNETVKRLVDENKKEELIKALNEGLEVYKKQFGSCSDILLNLCEKEDYKAITKYLTSVCNELEDNRLSIKDPIYNGKINMLVAFYKDVYEHNFKGVFDFANTCNQFKLLSNLIRESMEEENKKSR
jgi:hypothetical protein